MSVRIVTDTTAYLPAELVREHEIGIVSLTVHWETESEREIEIPDLSAFYDRLRSAERLPTTSQPSIGDFVAVYKPLLEAGHDILSVHISGGLSGTYQTAELARRQLETDGFGPGRILVLDSRSACGGLGAVVLVGVHAVGLGHTLRQVHDRVAAACDELHIWFAVDTLEYLRRGGRIGAASAWIGSTLKIKPILTIESTVIPVERVRTHKRAVARIVEYGAQKFDAREARYVVQHIQAADHGVEVVARSKELFGSEPLYFSEVGPVMGTHAGPGMIGFAVVPSRFFDVEM